MCTQAYEYFIRLFVYVYEGKDIIWNTMSDVQHWGWYKLFLFDCVDRKEVTPERWSVIGQRRMWARGSVMKGLKLCWTQHRRGRTHQLKHTQTCFRQCPSCFIWVLEITCNVLQLLLHEMTMVNCIATCLEPLRIPWQPLITFSGCSLSFELENTSYFLHKSFKLYFYSWRKKY